MQLRRAAPALLALPLLLAAAPIVAELGFQPSDGSKATRDYSIQFDFELGDLTVIADGQDMSEMMPGDFDGKGELKIQTQDHFVRSAGGRALELIRTFGTIDASMEAGGESQDMDGSDDLEGKSVRFLWNEQENDYDVAYHECEGDESDLQSVGADMDLSVLLPDRAVEVGDVWTVGADQITQVLLFGANLEDDEAEDAMFQTVWAELEPQFDALAESVKLTCEYEGERDEAGVKVGVIGLDLVGEGEIDLEPVIRAVMESQELPVQVDLSFNAASLGLSMTGKGELLWNVQRGLLHAFDMGADVELAVDLDVGVDAEGESHEMQAEVELLGRGTWQVRTPAG
jgi:hypothetical protein